MEVAVFLYSREGGYEVDPYRPKNFVQGDPMLAIIYVLNGVAHFDQAEFGEVGDNIMLQDHFLHRVLPAIVKNFQSNLNPPSHPL